jgi:hypothetical protein
MKLHLVIGVGLALSLSACSGKEEASQMKKLADQMCACKDVDCADKLFPEIEKFSNANAGKEVSAGAADDYNAQIGRTEKCYTKLHEDAAKNEK